jgi:hypothetical protein
MKTKYDWSNVPEGVKWIATDHSTGVAQGHKKKPTCSFDNWLSSSIKYWLHMDGYQGNWQDSLEERPYEIK